MRRNECTMYVEPNSCTRAIVNSDQNALVVCCVGRCTRAIVNSIHCIALHCASRRAAGLLSNTVRHEFRTHPVCLVLWECAEAEVKGETVVVSSD